MRKSAVSGVLLAVIVLLSDAAAATELHVPSGYSTIQAAIDAAIDGDTVIISPGTYTGNGNRDLDFGGKAITVRSAAPNDPNIVAATVIDCNGSAGEERRGFNFHSGEDVNSVVEGLTITNGYIYNGAGICCIGASPTISRCRFIDGTATNWGGGIYCYGESFLIISDCNFIGNSAFEGGAITTRSNWDITCAPLIKNCLISSNNCLGSGGGINSDCLSTSTIENCVITGNYAGTYGGGGVSIFQSNPTITNCLITGNSTDNCGGGVLCWYPDDMETRPIIKNCTIVDNYSHSFGGGIYADRECNLNVTDTIIRDNYTIWEYSGNEIALLADSYWDPPILSLSYSDVTNDENEVDIFIEPGCVLNWGPGNIDADPCFVSGPDGDCYLSQIAAGQAVDSPCVDAGSDTAANLGMDIFTTRTDHVDDAGVVDMGYHYPANHPDLNNDGVVNLLDFAILALQWLEAPGVPSADIAPAGGDGIVDELDLEQLADNWLD